MKKILMKAVMTSISEVMETMFFLPVEIGEEMNFGDSEIDQSKSIMVSELKFTGDVSGSLCILAPKDLIGEMAENFMGEDRESLSDDHLSGTLTEMLNMVCGNALSKTDSKIPFELGIPEMIDEKKISDKELLTIVETTQSKMAICLRVN